MEEYIKHLTDQKPLDFDRINKRYFCTKSIHWKYEEEWRLLVAPEYPDKIHETMEFKSDALEGIVLGVKTTEEDEERIINLVAKRDNKISIYRAKQLSGSFDLEFVNNPIL